VVLSNLQVIHSGHTRTVAWRGKVPVPDIRGRVIARGIVNESLVNALSPVIRLGSWQREKRLWPVACDGRCPVSTTSDRNQAHLPLPIAAWCSALFSANTMLNG